MEHRQHNGTNTWHWRPECSQWPNADFARHERRPYYGALCDECTGHHNSALSAPLFAAPPEVVPLPASPAPAPPGTVNAATNGQGAPHESAATDRVFTVMGMSPRTGKIVSVDIAAASPERAREKAMEMGLTLAVIAAPLDADPADAPRCAD